VRTEVVLRRHLDVIVVPTAVYFLIFDAQVREVHFIVEVRQLMLKRPGTDLPVGAIGMPVVIRAIAIPFMEPLLVLALELVIEDDSIDTCATVPEALRLAFVRAIDLKVVFELSLAFDAMPERLTVTVVAVTMAFELRPSFVSATACSREPGTRTVVISPCSRRCRRSPERGSAGRS
jgi:hypothetical protein